MTQKPKPTQLRDAAKISLPYASQIINGKRPPPRSLAICFYRKLGWKHDSIAGLTDEQIDVLETVDPWVPMGERP